MVSAPSWSYWVLPAQVLAGPHPSAFTEEATQERVKKLLDAGIRCFVDLTHPGERDAYEWALPAGAQHRRFPIRDHGVPREPAQMAEILEFIAEAVRAQRPLYVHCHAGIGRTGTVAGCWLVQTGLSGESALAELNRLWRQSERSQLWTYVPETREQMEYVRSWTPRGAQRDSG
jgi:hypothetical protein